MNPMKEAWKVLKAYDPETDPRIQGYLSQSNRPEGNRAYRVNPPQPCSQCGEETTDTVESGTKPICSGCKMSYLLSKPNKDSQNPLTDLFGGGQ
tara:strand:- start:758 stop:1039 length:282 start_codon:yes stop_codon:yes gene_type:complete